MFLGNKSRKAIDASLSDILEANLEEALTLDDFDEAGEGLAAIVEDDEFVFLDE